MNFEEIENKDGFWITADIRGANVGGTGVTYSIDAEFGVIFVASRPCIIKEVSMRFDEASTITLTNTGNTVVSNNLSVNVNIIKRDTELSNRELNIGSYLSLSQSGLTKMGKGNVSIYLIPKGKGDYR